MNKTNLNKVTEIVLKGQGRIEKPVFSVNKNDLLLNAKNHRFFTRILKAKINGEVLTQDKIKEVILSENALQNEKTKRSIITEGLHKPLVVNQDGIVLSGNRRLSIIKTIDEIVNVECVFIKTTCDEDIAHYEFALQFGEENPTPYGEIELSMYLAKRLRELRTETRTPLNEVYLELAQQIGEEVNDIKQRIERILTLEKVCSDLGLGKRYYLFKDYFKHSSMPTRWEFTILKNIQTKQTNLWFSNEPELSKKIIKQIKRNFYELMVICQDYTIPSRVFYVFGTKDASKWGLIKFKDLTLEFATLLADLKLKYDNNEITQKQIIDRLSDFRKYIQVELDDRGVHLKIETQSVLTPKEIIKALNVLRRMLDMGDMTLIRVYMEKLLLLRKDIEKLTDK